MRGVIERLVPAEGFGIAKGEDGEEYFIHANAMNATDFEELAVGWYIDFSVSPNHGGDEPGELPRGVNVRLAGQYPAVENEPAPQGKVN